MNQLRQPRRLIHSLLCGILFTLACVPLTAQETDAAAPVFDLSPFEVEGDTYGYVATTQVSGTRVNVAIKDTPLNLEVITADFLEDTGATGFKDSLTYSAGIFTDSFVDTSGASPESGDISPSSRASVGDPRNNAIMIRGFNAPFQQRFGFRLGTYIGIRGGSTGLLGSGTGGLTLGGTIDNINVDRIEIVRGPSALLYGLGVISGIANILPKEPLPEFRTNLQFGVGSEGFRRAGLDTTGPILKKDNGTPLLDYRFMTAYEEAGNWTDFYLNKHTYYAGQLKWYPAKGMSIFAEMQGGKTRIEGLGPQFVRDGTGNEEDYWRDPYNRRFRNEYGEYYRWGYEDFAGPYPDIWDPSKWEDIWGDNAPDPSRADQLKPLEGPFLSHSARVTGPDTYYERKEWNATVKWNWTLNEHLALSVGAYHTEQDIEELQVIPEVQINNAWDIRFDPTSDDVSPGFEEYGFAYEVLDPSFYSPLAGGGGASTDGRSQSLFRVVSTYWSKYPTQAESTQFQGDLRYQFETPFLFDSTARHSFLLGGQYIKDEADLPLGVNGRQNQIFGSEELGWRDSVRFISFYDWDQTIRYQGEDLVQPGANYYSTELWYKGAYLVYHGRFFKDRFSIIAGMRHDSFQAYEERWDRLPFTNERNPDRISTPNDYGGIGGVPGAAEAYYNFEKPVGVDTGSFGFTYALTDSLNIYGVIAQGVIPNTGQRDGDGLSIDPEETFSKEIGFKFDFLEGRISGTVSVFQMDRENAIWGYFNAPAPGKWIGGRSPYTEIGQSLDPEPIINGLPISYGVSWQLYFRDKVFSDDPVEAKHWQDKLGVSLDRAGNPTVLKNTPKWTAEDGLSGNPAPGIISIVGNYKELDDSKITDDFRPYVYITYDQLQKDPELKAVMEDAFNHYSNGTHPADIAPISYSQRGDFAGFNASNNTGGNVTFEEQVEGIDGQLFFTLLPERNLQIIFNFAHIERTATSEFDLVAAEDWRYPEFGGFGTEYDVWVRDFGRENFEDPTDPTTLKGGVSGKSLYYGSEDTLSLWGKYSFIEGPLENFEVGIGARYIGPARTFIPIARGNQVQNRYATPDTEGYYQFDGVIAYNKSFKRFDLRLSLNLYNILDKDTLYTEVSYPNADYPEITEKRRSLRYLPPFRMRLSATISF